MWTQLCIHIDPDTFDLRIFAHCIKAHLSSVSRQANTAEWRTWIDPLVAIDPNHAIFHVTGKFVGSLQVVGPQATA